MMEMYGSNFTNGPVTERHLAAMLYRYRHIAFPYRREAEGGAWQVHVAWAPAKLVGVGARFGDSFLVALPGISSRVVTDRVVSGFLFPSWWLDAQFSSTSSEARKIVVEDGNQLGALLTTVFAEFKRMCRELGSPLDKLAKDSAKAEDPDTDALLRITL